MSIKVGNFLWYRIMPIDDFTGSVTLEEFIASNIEVKHEDYWACYPNNLGAYGSLSEISQLFEDLEKIRNFFLEKEELREGIRGGPHVFSIPCEGEFKYGFIFKEVNNGTCHIFSPVKLPHLIDLLV